MKTSIITFTFLICLLSATARDYRLDHPCLLHTEADFEYVKSHISEEPYASALTKLKGSSYCKTSYQPSPVEYIARLDANNWGQLNGYWESAGIADLWYEGIHNNYTRFMRDAAAAYQLALLYRIEGNVSAANASKNIIVQWSKTNKGLLRNTAGEIVDPNEKLIMFQPYQMAVAAEMLRDYNGWSKTAEFKTAVKWLDNAFYGVCHDHLELQNSTGGGHYWLNWDLASMTTILALGILSDNQDYINEAIEYFKDDRGGPGNIRRGVPFLHEDNDSDELIGQSNELGRDQGHNSLCAAVMGTFCQMALAIGEDLFAYDNFRAIAFAEYCAKYNLAKSSLYPDPMLNFTAMRVGETDSDFVYDHASFPYTPYTYGDKGLTTEPSKDSRGSVRPGWDYWVGYANTHGLSAVYCEEMAAMIRPDGGGGQYSSNSGGFDQIGFSTLMGFRPVEIPELPGDDDDSTVTTSFEPVADTQVRKNSTNDFGSNTNMEIYYTLADDGSRDKEFYGLMRFELPPEILDGTAGKLTDATLRLVCVQNKADRNMALYDYGNDFEEKTTFAKEETFVKDALTSEPIATFRAEGQSPKALTDGGITQSFRSAEAWTSYIDLTDYVAEKIDDSSASFNILISKLNPTAEAMRFATRDAVSITNNEGFTFAARNLKPLLTVTYEKSEDDVLSLPAVEADASSSPVYYNLQGMRVTHPTAGTVHIEKTASTVKKILFR